MTFKTTLIVCLTVSMVVVLLNLTNAVDLVWLLLPISLFLLALIYGSANIQSGFFAPAFCSGNNAEKRIALSFDDGPDPIFTPKILAVLEQYQAPASFFVIGKNIEGNEALLKQTNCAGHIIANHSYTHASWIDFKSTKGFENELQKTESKVFAVLGKRPALFRPPFGVMTPHLVKATVRLNYKIIGWSVRSFDTVPGSVETVSRRIQTKLKPGAVILLHDTSEKSVEVLRQILDFARRNDYIIVNLEQLLNVEAYKAN